MGKERYIMKKRIRQYIGLLSAVLAYYAVHEGAHLLYALSTGGFRQINFMGIGMQIGIYEGRMSDTGIALLLSEWLARSFFGVLLVINCVTFLKVVLPKYKEAFAEQ